MSEDKIMKSITKIVLACGAALSALTLSQAQAADRVGEALAPDISFPTLSPRGSGYFQGDFTKQSAAAKENDAPAGEGKKKLGAKKGKKDKDTLPWRLWPPPWN